MPAAAVIPAPIAYIKAVAVKKLVVGSESSGRAVRLTGGRLHRPGLSCRGGRRCPSLGAGVCPQALL